MDGGQRGRAGFGAGQPVIKSDSNNDRRRRPRGTAGQEQQILSLEGPEQAFGDADQGESAGGGRTETEGDAGQWSGGSAAALRHRRAHRRRATVQGAQRRSGRVGDEALRGPTSAATAKSTDDLERRRRWRARSSANAPGEMAEQPSTVAGLQRHFSIEALSKAFFC
jgi:hypothetical protein